MLQLYAVSSLKASPSYCSPDSHSLILPLLLYGPDYGPHCLLAYEIASAERTVTHREEKCVHLWEQRKWTTQEPLSQPHSPRATTSGWYERKIEFEEWRTKSPARESARVCVCVCTNRTQVRHLVDQAWQGSHQTILDLRERTSQIIYEKESLKSVPYMEINTSVKLVKCWLFSFLLNV